MKTSFQTKERCKFIILIYYINVSNFISFYLSIYLSILLSIYLTIYLGSQDLHRPTPQPNYNKFSSLDRRALARRHQPGAAAGGGMPAHPSAGGHPHGGLSFTPATSLQQSQIQQAGGPVTSWSQVQQAGGPVTSSSNSSNINSIQSTQRNLFYFQQNFYIMISLSVKQNSYI